MIITASSALIGGALENNVSIEYSSDVITSIVTNSPLPPTISGTLLPGFVDIHCHGGGGYYFSALNPDQIETVIRTHVAHGTTSMLASLVSEPINNLIVQIKALLPFIDKSPIKGIHLEGPYLAHSHCGAHDPALLRLPSIDELKLLIDASQGQVRMVTLAPELDGAIPAIEFLISEGITVALGHTGADAPTTRAAIASGATLITHFNNAMPKLGSQNNISTVSLGDPTIALELILDGIHLSDSNTKSILATAPNRIIAITDAMSAAGVGDGNYTIGKLDVQVKDGIARLTSRDSLAGSTLTMDRAFLNLMNNFGFSIADAVHAASILPAKRIGLSNVGSIEVGKAPNFIELSIDGEVKPLN